MRRFLFQVPLFDWKVSSDLSSNVRAGGHLLTSECALSCRFLASSKVVTSKVVNTEGMEGMFRNNIRPNMYTTSRAPAFHDIEETRRNSTHVMIPDLVDSENSAHGLPETASTANATDSEIMPPSSTFLAFG